MTDTLGRLNRRQFILGMTGLTLSLSYPHQARAFQPFEPFTFAYITDVHLTNDQPDSYILFHESQLFLQELIKDVNSQNLDFVMFGGDQVEGIGRDDTNWQLFSDIAQGLNAPWSFVLGEADIGGNRRVDKAKTFGPDWKSRGIQAESSYWSHNLNALPNVHLIGLDTSVPGSMAGAISEKQLEWLKADLAANKNYLTIVFSHHPILAPPPYDGGPPFDEYVIPDTSEIREVLGGYPNVKLVVSGHVHVSKVQRERDIWHISSPSITVYPCAYRIFRVTPEAVTIESRSINFPALLKKAKRDLIESAYAGKFSRSNPQSFVEVVTGTRLDNEALLPLAVGKAAQPYDARKAQQNRIDEDRPAPEAPKAQPKSQGKPKDQPSAKANDEPPRKRGMFRRHKDEPKPSTIESETPSKHSSKPVEPQPKQAEPDLEFLKDIDLPKIDGSGDLSK